MTISEFIEMLQEYREQYGELTIFHDNDTRSPQEIYEDDVYVDSEGLHILREKSKFLPHLL